MSNRHQFQEGNTEGFKPGRSGNPQGRLPTSPKTLTPGAREVTAVVFKERLGRINPRYDVEGTRMVLEVIIDEIIEAAIRRKNKWAQQICLNYGIGLPKQVVELDAQIGFTDALTRIRNRSVEALQSAPPQLPEASQNALERVATPANGHSDAETVEALELATPEEKTDGSFPETIEITRPRRQPASAGMDEEELRKREEAYRNRVPVGTGGWGL